MSGPLWTYNEIAKAVDGITPGKGIISGISINSRETGPGDLFIALKGEKSDGHKFVKEAFTLGAEAALVSRTPPGIKKDDPRLIRVKDTKKGLWKLAAQARKRSRAKIVAITGSAGKTGTRHALFQALSMKAKTHTSERSFNNEIGVPVSLARMPADSAFGVFEVGMNRPGEIAPLSKLIKPHGVVITNVAKGHMEAFESVEAIAREKADIFAGLQKRGFAVLNADNEYFELLKTIAKEQEVGQILSFSAQKKQADATLRKKTLHPNCSCLMATIGKTALTYKVAMPGHHWIMNSLAVLLATRSLGGDLGLAGLALADLAPLPGRGASHFVQTEKGGFTLVDESYNANPASMRAALDVFAAMDPQGRGRKIAVLADMEEVGKTARAEHQALAEDLKKAGVEFLYVRGRHSADLLTHMKPAMKGYVFSENRGIFQKLKQDLRNGDLVLIKGSRKARLNTVAEELLSLDRKRSVSGWGRPEQAAE